MSVPYDLAPTARLTGMHMVGTVVRRFLISYPVDPALLSTYLPPGAELSLHNGQAWISDCFVRMDDMRLHMMPTFTGVGYNYLIHRTRARLPFPDGQLREAVLVLQPNINCQLLSTFGGMLTGVGFQTADIDFTEDDKHWRVTMRRNNVLLYDAEIVKNSCSTEITHTSQFAHAPEADDFLLGISFGGQWEQGSKVLKLLPETHEPWETKICTSIVHKNAFIESLVGHPVTADHVITMTDIPHYFGITPIVTTL